MAAPSGAEGLQRAGDSLRRARAALAKAIEEAEAEGLRATARRGRAGGGRGEARALGVDRG